MGVWFPSNWLAQSTFALLVSAVLASCGSSAHGGILLITIPDGTLADHLQGNPSLENWPWEGPTSADETDQPARPAVNLAPEISPTGAAKENILPPVSAAAGHGISPWAAIATAESASAGSLLSAVSAAVTHIDLTERQVPPRAASVRESLRSFFTENIVRGFMHPAYAVGWENVTASVSRWREQGSELQSVLLDQQRWQRLLRASLEAQQVALAEGPSDEPSSPVEAAAVEAAPLEAAPPVAASAHLPATHVRFSTLARPLILKLAGAFNQAGNSLESLASQLDQKDPPQSGADKQFQGTGQSIIKHKNNAAAPPQDPAAEEFFEF